tara:strand:- start:140 stop:1033 length:894 start_codon:yes stop_codon:yes gene_type:complete
VDELVCSGLNECALFAGAGGGILGGKLLGWRTRVAVEIDPYARRVLLARQRDGILPRFPIWDDVRTFDGKPWRGSIDVISGGFPCQDISAAGRGEGITGKRSGLWSEMARIVGEVVPRFVFVENSPMLTSRGLGVVLGDLAALGYDARWGVLGAHHAEAPHKRDRIWILARHADSQSKPARALYGKKSRLPELVADASSRENSLCELQTRREIFRSRGKKAPELADASGNRLEGFEQTRTAEGSVDGSSHGHDSGWWEVEPDVGRVAHGVAHRVDRLRAIGNGQVPAVVRLAWETLI